MNKIKFKNDLILIIAVLLIAVISLTAFFLTKEPGNNVVITVEGKEFATYSLLEEINVDILSDDGNVNTLVIKDGKASVSYADCPDKVCVNHFAISSVGESIICLPHKVVISIVEI